MFKLVLFFCCAVFVQQSLANVGLCPDAKGNATNAVCQLACQFPNNGSFTPNALACNNQLPDATCTLLFPCSGNCSTVNGSLAIASMTPDKQPYVRNVACNDPAAQTQALQCAKQCALCCQTAAYNCVDDPRSPINCGANIGNCRNPSFQSIMTQYCPATCGLCGGGCTDAIAGCSGLTALCNDISWSTYMKTNCASTCGTCGGSPTPSQASCNDVASNCAANVALCSNSVYYSLMTQQCPRTCGRCGSSSSYVATTCVDSNPSCSTWVRNGFCSSNFYTTAQKRQYCASSCSLC
uniref:ShKT domain-containing protein n=1 Tax=Panagrolaimus sp. JU765 TaxID=591449 RepID=A0AC34RB31_9BILA